MNALRRFMEGRYGWDRLNYTLAIAALAVGLLSNIPFLYLLRYVQLAMFGIVLWRALSRNTEKRYRENMTFISLWGRVKMWFQQISFGSGRKPRRPSSASDSYKHYSCPRCAKTLRVPRGKGKIMITCPVCHERFNAKS